VGILSESIKIVTPAETFTLPVSARVVAAPAAGEDKEVAKPGVGVREVRV
jgi:hypothetical protein